MAENATKYLDPRVLARISRLELKARLIVEGFITGMHRSPYHGFSVEFAEHREYVPGDDVRHIDWKVFGRSDRYYIKQYEEETNLTTHILVDASESMTYASDTAFRAKPVAAAEELRRGSRGRATGERSSAKRDVARSISKYEYACYIAAGLSHLLLRQQDAVGLALFDDQVRGFVSPRSTPSHLSTLTAVLEKPAFEKKTDLGRIFHEYASKIKRRGLIVIISDLLDDADAIERGLKHLRYRDHEVLVFHVLDHDELTFPFQNMTLFEGLEGADEVLANPPSLREGYLRELDEFLERVSRICRNNRFDYVRLDTRDRLDVALSSYLAKRAGSQRR